MLLIIVVCLGMTQQDRIATEGMLPTQQQHTIVFQRPQNPTISAATSQADADLDISMTNIRNASASSVVKADVV